MFIISFFILNFAIASDCKFSEMNYCAEMKIISSKMTQSKIYNNLMNVCEASFEETLSKKIQTAVLDKCPKFRNSANVYIRKSCLLGDEKNFDQIEIFKDGKCVENPIKSIFRFKKELKSTFKPGMKVADLKKYDLFLLKKEDKIWTFHSYPGVSIKFEIDDLGCGKNKCSDDDAKIKKSITLFPDFIDFVGNE